MLNVIEEVISTAADPSDSCTLATSCARWYTEVHCTRLSTVLSMELLPVKLGYGRDASDTLVTATTSTVPVTLFPSYVTVKEAVPEALLSAALIWFCVMEMRGLAVVKAVLEAEDTTTVLPSKNLTVTVAVLRVGMLIGDAAARLFVCAILVALNESVSVGAAVGARVVGAPVGDDVGENVIALCVGAAVAATMVDAPADMALGAVSLVSAVFSCTVPMMEDEVKLDPLGTVIWIVPTSTSPVVVPAGKVPVNVTSPDAASTVQLNELCNAALPALHVPMVMSPVTYPSTTV
jgi:hypothetical protein